MVYFRSKKKKIVTLPHSAQSKHTVFGENKENLKNKEIAIQEENCFIIVAPEIMSHIYQIIVVWGYC